MKEVWSDTIISCSSLNHVRCNWVEREHGLILCNSVLHNINTLRDSRV